jgi:pimeloyl-ACP methyl ester carboxylesterase
MKIRKRRINRGLGMCLFLAAVIMVGCSGPNVNGPNVSGPNIIGLNVSGPDVSGTWLGSLTINNQSLRIVFNLSEISDSNYTGTADSPDEGVFGMPLDHVIVNDHSVSLEIPDWGATFAGNLASGADSISGVLSQSGVNIPLVVQKQPGPLDYRRPQDPVAPYPYQSQDVTFCNADAGITLAGTLTWPQGVGPFKAVVFITGSGPQNRNEELLNHRPFLVLSDALTRAGIATLRYDDRGFGKSTGDFDSATSPDLAADVRAAIKFMRGQQYFSVSSIGLLGHSEGGMIAPMASDGNDDVAFMVLLAGPGMPGDQIIISQRRAIGAADSISDSLLDAQEAAYRRLFACVYATSDPNELDLKLRSILTSLGITGADQDLNVKAINNPWMRYFLTYDPIPVLRRTLIPVLVLNGSIDLQVVADLNLPPIAKALQDAGNQHATVQKIEGLNHLFQHAGNGSPKEYGVIAETMAPEVLKMVSTWIAGQ